MYQYWVCLCGHCERELVKFTTYSIMFAYLFFSAAVLEILSLPETLLFSRSFFAVPVGVGAINFFLHVTVFVRLIYFFYFLQQKWPILYHRILDLDLTEPRTVKKYLKHVESALKIFNYTLLQTMPSMREPSHINHLENCFLLFFQVAIANMPTDMFVETVNNFNVIEMCANYLANILKVLVGKKKLELSSLTDGYLHFTKSIIVFMRNEKTQQSSQYPITLALIRLYSEMEVYGHCVDNGAAFKQCYALIEMAVKMCSCVADRDKLIDNLILQLK